MSDRPAEEDSREVVDLHSDSSMPQVPGRDTGTCHDRGGDIVRDPQSGDYRISQEETGAAANQMVDLPSLMKQQLEKTPDLSPEEWHQIWANITPEQQQAIKNINRPGTCFESCERYGILRPEQIFPVLVKCISPQCLIGILNAQHRDDLANIVSEHTRGVHPTSAESSTTRTRDAESSATRARDDGGTADFSSPVTASEDGFRVSRFEKISALGFSIKHSLGMKLNIQRADGKDWRLFGQLTGLDDIMIQNLGSNYPDKTKEILMMWQSNPEATTGKMWQILTDMGRTDIAKDFLLVD